jgi:hypothetical protein
MTTQDSVLLNAVAGTSRPLVWISLDLPSQGQSLSLFGRPRYYSALYQAVMDCGYHLRTMAHLQRIFAEQ